MTRSRDELIGDCRLILGDCLQVLPTLPLVDAIVTDPPYGVGLGGANDKRRNGHGLGMEPYASYEDSLANFIETVVPAISLALGKSQRALVFSAFPSASYLPRPDSCGGVFLPAGAGRNRWGFNCFSLCLLYGTAPELNRGGRPTATRSSERPEKNGHPCPKPLGWMTWALELATRAGHDVLDPFMGSGTTGVACAQLGRSFIGIEIEPAYFDIACRRIEAATRESERALAAA